MTGENLKDIDNVQAAGLSGAGHAGAMGRGKFSAVLNPGGTRCRAGFRADSLGFTEASGAGALKRGAFLCLCALFLFLGGCAPKQASTPAGEATPEVAGDPFAVAVSRMMPGEQAVMATPFGGDGLVQMEGSYTSGLGQSCRRAQVTMSGAAHRIAVCRDESGWFTAGSIFETLPR